MEEFCKKCGIKLSQNIATALFGGAKVYEFEDGTYCNKCAKNRVDSARNK